MIKTISARNPENTIRITKGLLRLLLISPESPEDEVKIADYLNQRINSEKVDVYYPHNCTEIVLKLREKLNCRLKLQANDFLYASERSDSWDINILGIDGVISNNKNHSDYSVILVGDSKIIKAYASRFLRYACKYHDPPSEPSFEFDFKTGTARSIPEGITACRIK